MKKEGMSTAGWYSLACQPLLVLKDFTLNINALNQGLLSKLKPTSQIRIAKPFHPTCKNVLSLVKKFTIFTKNLLIWYYIPKQSHYVRCPAL